MSYTRYTATLTWFSESRNRGCAGSTRRWKQGKRKTSTLLERPGRDKQRREEPNGCCYCFCFRWKTFPKVQSWPAHFHIKSRLPRELLDFRHVLPTENSWTPILQAGKTFFSILSSTISGLSAYMSKHCSKSVLRWTQINYIQSKTHFCKSSSHVVLYANVYVHMCVCMCNCMYNEY